MTPEDTKLALLGTATAVGGFVIARAAIDDFMSRRRAAEYDTEEFERAHAAAFGIYPQGEPVMNEVVAFIAAFAVGTAALLQASDWALKQAGR